MLVEPGGPTPDLTANARWQTGHLGRASPLQRFEDCHNNAVRDPDRVETRAPLRGGRRCETAIECIDDSIAMREPAAVEREGGIIRQVWKPDSIRACNPLGVGADGDDDSPVGR